MKNPLLEFLHTITPGHDTPRDSKSGGSVMGARSFDVFHALADNTTDLLLYFNLSPRPRIVYINPACEDFLGYPQDKFYSHPNLIFDIIAPEDRSDFRSLFSGDFLPAYRNSVSMRMQRADNAVIWTELSQTTIFSEDGVPDSTLIIARDITSRKKAQESLKENQKFISSLLDYAPHSTMVINPDTSIRYVNPAWEELNGWTLHEVIGTKAPYPWWPEENSEETLAAFLEALQVPSGNGETVAVKRDGERYDLMFNWAAIHENGEIKYILLNSMDITEKNRLQKQLQDSQEIFSAAFRSSPDMMNLVSIEDGKYLEVNDSFIHNTGYSREELIGSTGTEIALWVNEEDNDEMYRLLTQTGSIRLAEYQFRKKTGEIRTWLCSADVVTVSGKLCILAVATDITEKRQAQDALRESEERFYRAFNSSPGSVTISRLSDGKFIEVNESFLRDKGFTREEVIGRTATDLNMWVDYDRRNYIMDLLHKNGRFQNELVDYHTKDGHIKTGYYSGEIINIDNEPCLIMQTTDITALKKAEKQLRLLGNITEQVSDSTIVTGPDLRITYMNRAACELFGYTNDEVVGKHLSMFTTGPIAEESRKKLETCLEQGRVWTGIVTKKRKDGSSFISNARVAPLLDENGTLISYIDIQHDITAQKEAELRLQANNEIVESILSSMPEGVLVIGNDDSVVLANDAFYHIFMTSHRTVMNKPLERVIAVDYLNDIYQEVKNGKPQEKTLEFRYHKRGIEKIIATVITGMKDGRTLLTFADISRDREEEAKLYLTDRLASIGEMAAGLAHELNNPLTGILALSQMLLETDLPESHREDVSCIFDEAKRAAGIVKNVLLFTRNTNSEYGRSNVGEVIKDVLRLREYEAKINDITVVVDIENGLPETAIDRYQFQQVFLNLVLNAEAAIREVRKPGMLTISATAMNDQVILEVTDNGSGIKKNVLPRIFDPFFTTKDIGKGTGLGLSICYGIIVKHGGKISVKSQVNEGTTFTITLPVYTETEKPEEYTS